jgi:outer membrane protein OmpA-like peptidoglycan-associated protein/tetratricopeptide (TPR) repeat protein
MRTKLYSILLLCVVLSANAQENQTVQNKVSDKLLKMANAEFNNLRYAYAIPLFKMYLKKDANSQVALTNLATAYKINNQIDSAIKYFELAKSKGAIVEKQLTALHKTKHSSNKNKFAQDSLDYTLHYLAINTPFNEFAVVPTNNGIVFESNRAKQIKGKNEFSWDGGAFSALYTTNNLNVISFDSIKAVIWNEKSPEVALSDLTTTTSNDASTFSKKYDFNQIQFDENGVGYFDNVFNSKYNSGNICFTADSNTVYFTRNMNKTNAVFQLEIWSATKVNGKWDNFTKLEFNNNKASYTHPAISTNGNKLYFVSDQEGGFGGMDLYFVEKTDGAKWGSPVNVGKVVNTSGNELFPTISEGKLYISSEGHDGMGGLDIFNVNMKNDIITEVLNAGYPVNSAYDDMSFSRVGNKGFLVSNRYGSDDILSYDYKEVYILLSGNVKISDGKVANQLPISVLDLAGNPVLSAKTDANGNFGVYVRPNRMYKIVVTEPGGNKAIAEVNSKDYTGNGNTGYKKAIAGLMISVPAPPPAVVENKITFNNLVDSLKAVIKDYVVLHHDFDKVTLEKSHVKEYKQLLASIRKTKGARIVVVSAADCKGTDEYNEKLSARRASYISKQVIAASKKNEVIAMHVGERILAEPCEENANKDKQLENRYTYVFIQK